MANKMVFQSRLRKCLEQARAMVDLDDWEEALAQYSELTVSVAWCFECLGEPELHKTWSRQFERHWHPHYATWPEYAAKLAGGIALLESYFESHEAALPASDNGVPSVGDQSAAQPKSVFGTINIQTFKGVLGNVNNSDFELIDGSAVQQPVFDKGIAEHGIPEQRASLVESASPERVCVSSGKESQPGAPLESDAKYAIHQEKPISGESPNNAREIDDRDFPPFWRPLLSQLQAIDPSSHAFLKEANSAKFSKSLVEETLTVSFPFARDEHSEILRRLNFTNAIGTSLSALGYRLRPRIEFVLKPRKQVR